MGSGKLRIKLDTLEEIALFLFLRYQIFCDIIKHLLRICDNDNERIHYHKNQKICNLLEIETNYLIVLNINEYEVVKCKRRKVNKYGFIDIDTNKYFVR